MSIPFFSSDKKALNRSGYRIRKDGKKNFGKLRPIERDIVNQVALNSLEVSRGENLQLLCSTIRSWQSLSLAHKHRLKGVELYESMAQIATCVTDLRGKQDHDILKQLQNNLDNSIAGLQTNYEALQQGKIILDQLADNLYGQKNEKGNRNTEEYKIKATAAQVQQEVEQTLAQGHEQYKTHSSQMRGYLRHFQNTYQNWKSNLFTCYDHPNIPNDNNRLELSHSQMKKQHRRITGKSSTSKYLKIHGHNAAFILNFAPNLNSQQELENILIQADYDNFKQLKLKEKLKSQTRGKIAATKRNLDKTIEYLKKNWAKKKGGN